MSERLGTQGYSEEAAQLVPRYEQVSFVNAHKGIFDLIPPAPCAVIDIGAGSGRDAAWFAARGDHVTAVEPTAELRSRAMALHPAENIIWIDDGLPDLARVRGQKFDLVWLSAVWMHFTTQERAEMMPVVAGLVAPGGALMISLRHTPVAERRMFRVSATETIAHAEAAALRCEREIDVESTYIPGVRWSRLWFRRD